MPLDIEAAYKSRETAPLFELENHPINLTQSGGRVRVACFSAEVEGWDLSEGLEEKALLTRLPKGRIVGSQVSVCVVDPPEDSEYGSFYLSAYHEYRGTIASSSDSGFIHRVGTREGSFASTDNLMTLGDDTITAIDTDPLVPRINTASDLVTYRGANTVTDNYWLVVQNSVGTEAGYVWEPEVVVFSGFLLYVSGSD